MQFLALFFMLLTPLLACDEGIVRENQREISEKSPLANDMTEAQFKKIVVGFEKFFNERIENEYNKELIVYHSWSANTVNAYADQSSSKFMITIFGGFARHPSLTTDGLVLTLCHELGHHFGGYPKKSTNTWSSAEGQADYYATTKCLRRIWENENNIEIMRGIQVPALVLKECTQTYGHEKEVALCARMSLAGRSLALVFQDLDHDSLVPNFETPDPLVVRMMTYIWPYSQCRLDTYFQGAICPVPEFKEMDDYNQTVGTCHQKNGDTRGLRPQCWFVPRN